MTQTRPEPRLSQLADENLQEFSRELLLRLYDNARRRAIDEGLDTISQRHIDEAVRSLLPGFQRPSYWKNWADTMASAIFGVAAGALINEFLKPDRLTWNVPAMITAIVVVPACVSVITWAKLRP